MNRLQFRQFFVLTALILAISAVRPPYAEAKKEVDKQQEWKKLEKVYSDFFGRVSHHHPYAIITKSEVAPLRATLAKAGWKMTDEQWDGTIKLVLSDDDFIVRNLHTDKGRRFMRQVASKYPEVYDRLDRLAHTTGGGRTGAAGLIAAPDAEYTVAYMFSKGGERSWASMLPERYKFDQPTGRLYTAETLKKHLEDLYFAGT
jgi:hypothetical protein